MELLGIVRSADGSRLTVDLRRRRKVSCFEAGGWLPPPHNRVEEVVRIRIVIDCLSRRFDEHGDGLGWQPLEKDAAVRAIAADHCSPSHQR
jgi:hypothetical protein